MIICIEGMDAAGKTLQAKRIADGLKNAPLISFPTYSEHALALSGPIIAAHLKGEWATRGLVAGRPFSPENAAARAADEQRDAFVFQCLMTVNKYELADDIGRIVEAGLDVVLCRYWPSAFAYGLADGLPEEWLLRIHKSLPKPDLFVLLDIDHETSVERRPDRRDRYEQKGAEYFDRIRANYLKLWKLAPWGGNWIVLDGTLPADDVTERLWKEIDRT